MHRRDVFKGALVETYFVHILLFLNCSNKPEYLLLNSSLYLRTCTL